MDNNLITFLIAFFVGFSFIVVGLYQYFRNKKIRENGIKTQGRVVGYEEDSGDITTFKPIIEYQTTDNRTIQKAAEFSFSSKKVFQINETLIVFYDENKNEEFVIDNFSTRTLLPLLFTTIGLIILTLSIGIYLDIIPN